MKTDVEKLDPTRVKLSVEVPFSEKGEPALHRWDRAAGRPAGAGEGGLSLIHISEPTRPY